MSGILVESAAACQPVPYIVRTRMFGCNALVGALTNALSPRLTGFAPPLERLPLLSRLSHALTCAPRSAHVLGAVLGAASRVSGPKYLAWSNRAFTLAFTIGSVRGTVGTHSYASAIR